MLDPSYRTVAVATTFSPRFEQVLSEAKRIRDRFGSRLHLIYRGERNAETGQEFRDVMRQIQFPPDSAIHYQKGDPAEAILKAAAENDVDLVIAGALEKQVVLRPFLGNVARRLWREARWSVMLFTAPERPPRPLRKIVFVASNY